MGQLAKAKSKSNKKKIIKAQAEFKGVPVKDHLKDMLKNWTPMPGFVQTHLKMLSEKSGTSPHEIALYHIVHSMAILNAGTLLTGSPILNPFVSFEGGLVTDWEELYTWLRYEYERFFLASEFLEKK